MHYQLRKDIILYTVRQDVRYLITKMKEHQPQDAGFELLSAGTVGGCIEALLRSSPLKPDRDFLPCIQI